MIFILSAPKRKSGSIFAPNQKPNISLMTNRILFLFLLLTPLSIFAQSNITGKVEKFVVHPSDHFLFQLSSDRWLNAPDSIDDARRGNSRGANFYFMIDKPFHSNKKFSAAFGLGISTSHIFFEKTDVQISGKTPELRFANVQGQNYFKKYKVATTYLELPVELRFSSKPSDPSKSIKVALGARVGTLLNAHTKGKTLRDASGNTINSAIQKISARSYFNSNRLAATFRIGYGNYTLFGAYMLTPVLKDGAGADMRLLQVGFSFSGL